MVTDPISDMIIRIKNAQAVGREHISVPFSKVKFSIAKVLKENEFISDVEKKKKKSKRSELDYLAITLKYHDKNTPAMTDCKIISKPSRHMYVGAHDIKAVRSGYGISIISTSKGIMSSIDARRHGLGGEVLFEVW